MSFAGMIPSKCPNCGAPVNSVRMLCEYCGANFEGGTVRMIVGTQKCDTLNANICLDEEVFAMASEKGLPKLTEYALRELAQSMVEGIIPYMKYEQQYDPMTREVRYRSWLRVMRPDARF